MATPATLPRQAIRRLLAIVSPLLLGLAVAFPAGAADADASKATAPATAAADIDAEKLFGAIVKIATRATPGSRASARATRSSPSTSSTFTRKWRRNGIPSRSSRDARAAWEASARARSDS